MHVLFLARERERVRETVLILSKRKLFDDSTTFLSECLCLCVYLFNFTYFNNSSRNKSTRQFKRDEKATKKEEEKWLELARLNSLARTLTRIDRYVIEGKISQTYLLYFLKNQILTKTFVLLCVRM